jgi:hypothetical protein
VTRNRQTYTRPVDDRQAIEAPQARKPKTMDDARWEPGMPVLDRQRARPSIHDMPIRSVPETRPTPLQAHYINLSVVALICGAVAITALEMGAPASSLLVKLCVIVGAPILAATTVDATLRIWRAAWAWMPIDRTKGTFRLAWVAATTTLLALLVLATGAILRA